jgi:hypothetical protein
MSTVLCAFLMQAPMASAGEDERVRISVKLFEKPSDYPATLAEVETESVAVGDDFVVKVFVEDIRSQGARRGTFAAYLDINFDGDGRAELVTDLPGVSFPGSDDPTPFIHEIVNYGDGAEPSIGNGLVDRNNDGADDQIDLIGSFAQDVTGVGSGELLLVEFAMTAVESGTVMVTPESTTEDPAVDPEDGGESPFFDVLLTGQDSSVCPSDFACEGIVQFVGDSILVGGSTDTIFEEGFELP